MRLPKKITIGSSIRKYGIDIFVNKRPFPIKYPQKIWEKFPKELKNVLMDNLTYSSTIFLPQMLNLRKIQYETHRPLSETFLFKNGIYDMPISAIADKTSPEEYIKRFFNTRFLFKTNSIRTPSKVDFNKNDHPIAIVPFSFGKESLLNLALCLELGIKPVPVLFVEPSHAYEYLHKKKLLKKIEKEFNVKVHIVENNPGLLRYGKIWNLNTELGWGLHTTDYVLMSLPFAYKYNASMIILGNEQGCSDYFYSKDGILIFEAAYDQHSDWTTQQSLLGSLLLGRKIDVVSFVEPLHEIAEMNILHKKYPTIGKYQMSCFASNKFAIKSRWCQQCTKCGYMYALAKGVGVDTKSIGFTEEMFDKKHEKAFDFFFNFNEEEPEYGTYEEIVTAFYLAIKHGSKGYLLEKYKKEIFPKHKKEIKKYIRKYLSRVKEDNVPPKYRERLIRIFDNKLSEYVSNKEGRHR